jgi:hypothetical protein
MRMMNRKTKNYRCWKSFAFVLESSPPISHCGDSPQFGRGPCPPLLRRRR